MEHEAKLHTEIMEGINLRDKDKNFNKIVTLGVGDSFGELALMKKRGLRAARITAEQPVNLGVLDRKSYEKCLYKFDYKKQEVYIEFLSSIPFLKNLTRAVLLKVVKSFNYMKFRNGQ